MYHTIIKQPFFDNHKTTTKYVIFDPRGCLSQETTIKPPKRSTGTAARTAASRSPAGSFRPARRRENEVHLGMDQLGEGLTHNVRGPGPRALEEKICVCFFICFLCPLGRPGVYRLFTW